MRTWVLGLLLVLLPLQFVWAGVAAYCQHEADVVVDHVGHHEHQHAATADGDKDAADLDPVTPDAGFSPVDNDCGYCHLSCAQPIASAAAPWLCQAANVLVSTASMRYSTREPEGVERPNWLGLARSASLEEPRIS